MKRRSDYPLRRRALILILMIPAIAISACGGGSNSGSTPASSACATLPAPSSPDFLFHLTGFMNNLCYQKQKWQHDAEVRTSDGVHPYVKVWYSPPLFQWMAVRNR